jgi:hypothetical protein
VGVVAVALAGLGCSLVHERPDASATRDAPSSLHTWIWRLTTDGAHVCGVVSSGASPAASHDLSYGCFDDTGAFTSSATIGTQVASPYVPQLVIESGGAVSIVVGTRGTAHIGGADATDASCWVRVRADVVEASRCVQHPLEMWAVADDEPSDHQIALVDSPVDGAMASGGAIPYGQYVVDGLPLRDPLQAHLIDPVNIAVRFARADGLGGWVVAGDLGTAPEAWTRLPHDVSGQTPFVLRGDAMMNVTASQAYAPQHYTAGAALNPAGRVVMAISSITDTLAGADHFVAIEDAPTARAIGHGGQMVSLASSAAGSVVVVWFRGESITFGSTTLAGPPAAGGFFSALVWMDASGVVTEVRQVDLADAGTSVESNVVMLDDGRVAIGGRSGLQFFAP